MNIIDIILLCFFVLAIVQGLRKGFITQAISIVALILGTWMSFKFSSALVQWIGQWIHASETVLKITAFVIIFLLVIFGLFAIGKILEASIKIIMLGWLNKLLGVLFALLKYALIIGLLIILFNTINSSMHLVSEEYLAKSAVYTHVKTFAYSVFPYLKELLFK